MMVRRFFDDLIGAYVDGVRAILGLPLLFAILIGWEFAQHVAEVRIGFFASADAAHALSNDGSRMLLGWIKMISVYVGGFFVIRYLVQRQSDLPSTPITPAMLQYVPYLAYCLVMFALAFYSPKLSPHLSVTAFRAIVGLVQIFIEPLLMLWIVSSATSGNVYGPVQSARTTGLLYFWGLAMFFIGRIPVSALHQVFNRSAFGRQGVQLWSLLAADAVCVGLIISVIPALYVRITRFISERKSVPDPLARPSAHHRYVVDTSATASSCERGNNESLAPAKPRCQ